MSKPAFELHRIKVEPGGYCSIHKHETKFNAFYIEKGELIVKTWKADQGLVDVSYLYANDLHIVPPGQDHQFSSPEGCEALEIYYCELNPADISRTSAGGKEPAKEPTS